MKQIMQLLIGLLPLVAPAQPQATISNGSVTARLYLPDAQQGYYRGSRFDWSGVVDDLQWAGHTFFSPSWNEAPYSPTLHDAVGGPVEEFTAIGYDQAKTGSTFLKIGVGILQKPDEPRYAFNTPYAIVNGGQWTTKSGKDRVTFTQTLTDSSGYGYRYEKTARLVAGQPTLILEHRLRNTGRRLLETEVYDHNFFVIDRQTSGPDFVVRFPFTPQTNDSLRGMLALQGPELHYRRALNRGENVFASLQGYGTAVSDYDIRVENRQARVGVRVAADRPLSRLNYWTNAGNLSPEPYIRLAVAPGQETRWTIRYEFYALDR